MGGDNIRDRGALRLELCLVVVVPLNLLRLFTIYKVEVARRPRGRRRRRLLSDFDLGRSRDRNRGDGRRRGVWVDAKIMHANCRGIGRRRIRAQVFWLVARQRIRFLLLVLRTDLTVQLGLLFRQKLLVRRLLSGPHVVIITRI